MEGMNLEDYMDVVCGCKFCPYTCTQSPDMSSHVREEHLERLKNARKVSSSRIPPTAQANKQSCGSSSSSLAEALDAAVSAAVGKPRSPLVATSAVSTSQRFNTGAHSADGGRGSSGNFVSGGTNFTLQVSDDVLSFNSDSQTYMDKGLTSVSFTPLAVPVVPGADALSNTSTPDLSDLMNLVKPEAVSTSDNDGHHHQMTTNPAVDRLSVESVVDLSQPASTAGGHLQPFPPDPGSTVSSSSQQQQQSPGLDPSYTTVMAIQLNGYDENISGGSQPQYCVSTSTPAEPVNIPDTADTKEFLLCGLCKLAFTSMEDCQAHMQTEHRELMQGAGVSIGVQVGGAKRGRKKKSDVQPKTKVDPYVDPDDLEWLPSVSEGSNTTHPDGRVRRRVKPPKALKEDYVLGRRAKKKQNKPDATQTFKIICPMMNCKARFKSDDGLKIHISCHNLHDSAFTCKECQTPHEFWKNLRMHLWRNHQIDVDLLTCDVCNYKTDTPHKMVIHKEIHADIKPYACNVCGKGFRQMSQMKNHLVVHTGQEARDLSGSWYASKKCDVCDRLFSNSKCLKKHKEAVHSNIKPYQCPYCSHTTARKAMMQLHLRTHTGEKPFKCDVCPYTTGDHNSMRRHKMRHTGQKQYQCTLCPYTCIQSISLKQHMRHKHPGAAGGIFQCTRCPFKTINQSSYNNHVQDHKKGLIPDKIIPAKLDLPKARKVIPRSGGNSHKNQSTLGGHSVMESLLVKHPQFHAVLPGDDANNTLTSLNPSTGIPGLQGAQASQGEVFNMQVTMLPEGDTQVNAEDMARLSECSGLQRTGVSSLQLIYATLSTISEQSDVTQLGEGRSSLLTAELMGGIHTAVLSSMQDGVTVHSITYHLPAPPMSDTRQQVITLIKPQPGSTSDDKNTVVENNADNNSNDNTVVGVTKEDVNPDALTTSASEGDVSATAGAGTAVMKNEDVDLFLVNTSSQEDSEEMINVNESSGKVLEKSESASVVLAVRAESGGMINSAGEQKKKMGGSSSTLREMLVSGDSKVSNTSFVNINQMDFINDGGSQDPNAQ